MILDKKDTISKRRESLEQFLGDSLKVIGTYNSSLEDASKTNCENMVGSTQIPLGVAGPLKLNNNLIDKIQEYFIPIATTEGALVASINRGSKAITMSGGAVVDVSKVGITRSPVFYTKSIKTTQKFKEWLEEHKKEIKHAAESSSNHLKLLKMQIKHTSELTYLNLHFDTRDAMGMNMASRATDNVVKMIETSTIYKCISIAGNFDSDKKPSASSFLTGRGYQVWAEVTLTEEILKSVLKTTAPRLFEAWYAKCVVGSTLAGSIGSNAHIANVLSGIFISTGQDPAHVVEGSTGITTMRLLDNKSIYVSVYLPSLIVGIVGGGTKLPTQREALKIMKVTQRDGVYEFAGAIAGACLAGEISLISSLAEGTLVRSHDRLTGKRGEV